jgi:hypothetical protein
MKGRIVGKLAYIRGHPNSLRFSPKTKVVYKVTCTLANATYHDDGIGIILIIIIEIVDLWLAMKFKQAIHI